MVSFPSFLIDIALHSKNEVAVVTNYIKSVLTRLIFAPASASFLSIAS